jgi:ACT domain-containing protein
MAWEKSRRHSKNNLELNRAFILRKAGGKMKEKKAVISVVGKDQVGIIAGVTTVLADNDINILDISQTILQDFFTMMMLVEIKDPEKMEKLQLDLEEIRNRMHLKIDVQREDLFQTMHRI